MNAPELFSTNLRLIEQVARSVCRRRRMSPADVEDFVSTARLALMENDFAILRRYEGRSSLAAFLAVVFDNLISDQRAHALGRWHPSRAAERMGPGAILFEALVVRDGRSIDEALPLVHHLDPTLTRSDLEAMAVQLPQRVPRPRIVSLESDAAFRVVGSDTGDARTVAREARSVAARTSKTIRAAIESFGLEDGMLIRLHFGSKFSIADIARMLRLPQRPLYRRLEARLRDLRKALDDAGLDSRSVIELIGAATTDMNFGLETSGTMENEQIRQSLKSGTAGDQAS